MAKKTIYAQMKQRRDTKANWEATNPVLLDGEIGIVTDDPNLYKVGNGSSRWNSLPFRGFDGTVVHETGDSATAVMSQAAVSAELQNLSETINTNKTETDTKLTELESNTGVNEYPAFSSSTQYAAGSVVRYNNKLYRFTTLHPAGAWVGTDAIETSNKAETVNALKNGGAISLNKCFINGVIKENTGEIEAGYSKRLVFPFRIKGKYLSKLNVDQTNSTIKFWIGLYIYSNGSDVPTWSDYRMTDKFSWNFDADKEYNLLVRNSTDTDVTPSDIQNVYFSLYSELENREEENFKESILLKSCLTDFYLYSETIPNIDTINKKIDLGFDAVLFTEQGAITLWQIFNDSSAYRNIDISKNPESSVYKALVFDKDNNEFEVLAITSLLPVNQNPSKIVLLTYYYNGNIYKCFNAKFSHTIDGINVVQEVKEIKEEVKENVFNTKLLSKDSKSLIINAVIDENTGQITNYGYSLRAVFEDKLSGDIISLLNINQEQSTQKVYVGLYTYNSEDAVPSWSSYRTADSIIIPFEKGKYYNILIRTAEDSAFDVSDLGDISFGFEFRRDSEIIELHPYEKDAEIISSIARGFHNDSGSPFDVNPLVLMWCSDLHRNVENEKRLLDFKDRYNEYLDDGIHTGDIVNFYGDDIATYVNTPFCKNFLLCLGDHEYYDHKEGSTWIYASQSDVYNKFIAPFKDSWSGCVFPESGVSYYYKDYTAKKVRLIVLDFKDYTSQDCAQAVWLSEKLAETLDNSGNAAAGFHVVIAVHRTPFRTTMDSKNPFNSLEFNVADGGTVNSNIAVRVNEYIELGGHFACYLTGHQHIDHFGVGVAYNNQLNITVGTGDDFAGSNTQNIARVKGTDSQDLFNIVAIDTYNSTIRLARIGAKYDRYGREKKTLCYYYGYEAFDSSVPYTRAKIVEYDSKLYMFTGNHSGAWTGDDVVEIDRLMYC